MRIKSVAQYPHVVVLPELEKVLAEGEIIEVSEEVGNEIISRLNPLVVEVKEEILEESKSTKKKKIFENAANKELPEDGMFAKEFN